MLTQIKSGDSYGKAQGSGFKLTTRAVKEALKTSHSICVVWVNPDDGACFWAFMRPGSSRVAKNFGGHHELSPASIFDLARCSAAFLPSARGGGGITIPTIDVATKVKLMHARRQVLTAYNKQKKIFCPSIGHVELTRSGWRHMFRKSRFRAARQTSLEVIPYLSLIANRLPTTHSVTEVKFIDRSDGWISRGADHLLRYDHIEKYDAQLKTIERISVFIKIREEIRFPTEWRSDAMLSQLVERRLVLISCYSK